MNPAPRDSADKSLARSLGEFVGHIVHGIRANPSRRRVIRRDVQEADRPGMTLRRTTIDEIEVHDPDSLKPES